MKIFQTSYIKNRDNLGKNLTYDELNTHNFKIDTCSIPFILIDNFSCDITEIKSIKISISGGKIKATSLHFDNTEIESDEYDVPIYQQSLSIFFDDVYLNLYNDGFKYDEYFSYDVIDFYFEGEINLTPNVKRNSIICPYNLTYMPIINNYKYSYSTFLIYLEDDTSYLNISTPTNDVFDNYFFVEESTDFEDLRYTENIDSSFYGIVWTDTSVNLTTDLTAGKVFQVCVKTFFYPNEFGIFLNQIKIETEYGTQYISGIAHKIRNAPFYKCYKESAGNYTGGSSQSLLNFGVNDFEVSISLPESGTILKSLRVTETNEYSIESLNLYNDIQVKFNDTGINQNIENANLVNITSIEGVANISGNYAYNNKLSKGEYLNVSDGENTYQFLLVGFNENNIIEFNYTIPNVYKYAEKVTFEYWISNTLGESTHGTEIHTFNNFPSVQDIEEYISSSISVGFDAVNNYNISYNDTLSNMKYKTYDGFAQIKNDNDTLILEIYANKIIYGIPTWSIQTGYSPENYTGDNGFLNDGDYVYLVFQNKKILKFDLVNNVINCYLFFDSGNLASTVPETYEKLYVQGDFIMFIGNDLKMNKKNSVFLMIQKDGIIYSAIPFIN